MNKKIIFTDRSNELLTSYLRDIARYKILSAEEIASLILKAQAGDEDAKTQVVKSNLRFVVSVAKQYQNRGIPLMDLISSGNIGLITAIDRFDVSKGVTFLSYAVWWIEKEIYDSIYGQGREIRLPMSQQLIVNKITKATNAFMQEHGRQPTSVEISDITGIELAQIEFLSQYSNKLVSVDDFIGGDEDNSQVCDIIPDEKPGLDEELNKQYIQMQIENVLSKLTVREHDLICMLYGIGMTAVNPEIIASMYGVGRERIRQIKEGALSKLRRVYKKDLNFLL